MNNQYEEQLCKKHNLNKTQEKICQTFVSLYEKKEFDQITIKEICLNAPVARTTFYQYFNNTKEVKEIVEDNFVAGLLKSSHDLKFFDYQSDNYRQYLHSTLNFLRQNKYLFKVFLVIKRDLSFIEKYKISIKYHYYDLCHGEDAALEIISGYLIAIFSYFLSSDIEMTVQELEKYLHVLNTLIDSL